MDTKCNQCKGIRVGPMGTSPSAGNFTRNRSSSSSPLIPPTGVSVGGPESGDRRGDRDRVRKSRNITAVENLIQENTSEKMRIQEDQDQPDSSIEDEEDMGHTDPINSFVNTIRKKGYRDFNDVGSNALTRSIYVFGVVLLCGIAFGYSVALSNTGRIQVLEKEIRELKEGVPKDLPAYSSGWLSGRGFGNLFGLWESPGTANVDDVRVVPKWYESFPLFGSRNATTSD